MKRALVVLPMPISPLTLSQGGTECISLGGRDFRVRVPPGGKKGQRLRLPGIAHYIDPQIESGDVHLLILSKNESIYQIQRDVQFELRLNPVKLRKGFTERVNLGSKAVDVTIPSGVKSGQRLRLRNMAEHCNGGYPGDIYLQLATEARVATRRWASFDGFIKPLVDHFSKAESRKITVSFRIPGLFQIGSEWTFSNKKIGLEFDPNAQPT